MKTFSIKLNSKELKKNKLWCMFLECGLFQQKVLLSATFRKAALSVFPQEASSLLNVWSGFPSRSASPLPEIPSLSLGWKPETYNAEFVWSLIKQETSN